MNDSTDLIQIEETTETVAVETEKKPTKGLKSLLKSRGLLKSNKGASVIEYIVLIAVFVFAIVAGVQALSKSTNSALSKQGSKLNKIAK